MDKLGFKLLTAGILSLMLILSGCGSDSGGDTGSVGAVGTGDGTETGTVNDDGIDTGIAATATTVAGKVTLSSVVTAKARAKASAQRVAQKASVRGKPGSKAYRKAYAKALAQEKAFENRALPSRAAGDSFEGGFVELYNSSRSDWLFPVAKATTDAAGTYTLDVLINAENNGDAYTNGDAIPGGNYTLMAYTKGRTGRPVLVALQAVVSEFAGSIAGVDLVAQKSDASPKVTTMLGVSKNTDGTQTWGDAELALAPNAALQVAFSMPMSRLSMDDVGLVIAAADSSTVPSGSWTISADWLTATYYLASGQAWAQGVTYTVTINGQDSPDDGTNGSGDDIAVYNVFGRSLKKMSVATFSIPANAVVDEQAPTAQLSSPTLAQTATPIEVITPIRIASNERMDVNGLRLKADPSLGAQPGVLFVGKNASSLYEYEFLLGNPLQLATTYTITVSGGKDLAGNEMNALTASFTTEATSEGIAEIPTVGGDVTQADVDAAIELASNQADVKDVFGKWVRAFSDRNLPQLQSVMAGDFFMEYSTADGFNENDVNRDGVYDLSEFSEFMAEAFVLWDHCGVTLEGNVAEAINIVGGEIADFEFTLAAETTDKSQACQTAAPNQSLFATLQKVNGAWYVVRSSEGIDTRGQEIKEAVILELVTPADAIEHEFEKDGAENPLTFEWSEVADAASYALIVIDSRNPKSGFALILPPTTTSVEIPAIMDEIETDEAVDADGDGEGDGTSTKGKMIAEDFGFTDKFDPRNGSELYWQVAALGSNTLNDVQAGRQTSLPKDVTAISELWRFKIAGEYQELNISVEANASPVTFSEFIHGYDVDDAALATVTVSSPRLDATKGCLIVDGNTHEEIPLTFALNATGDMMVASADINLNVGNNNINAMDGIPEWAWGCKDDAGNAGGDSGAGSDGGGDRDQFVEEWFQIITTGGIKPVIVLGDGTATDSGITAYAADDTTGTLLVNDGWDWYESSSAVSLMIEGEVDVSSLAAGSAFRELRLDVWNDEAHARATRKIDINDDGTFSTTVEVFKGENWVGIHGEICDDTKKSDFGDRACQFYNANFGINTSAGSVYVAPISAITVHDSELVSTTDAEAGLVTQKEDWGDGGMWEVTAVTGNQVVISGEMEFATDNSGNREPRYDVGSDGGWVGERLSVNLDGTFSITVDLFEGWNYVSIQDVNDNWYHLDLYTTAGNEVIRPEITQIDDTLFDDVTPFNGEFATTQCSVTLQGTAAVGEVRVTWSGNVEGGANNEFQNFWEENVTETDASGNWSATIALVGSGDDPSTPGAVRADNFIDVFDSSWNWMGVRVINTGDCTYTPPRMSVTTVKDDAGNELSVNNSWEDPWSGGGGADYGPAGSVAAKAIVGSVGVDVSTPTDGQTGLGTGTSISGIVDLNTYPMTGTEVLRITMSDPTTHTPTYFWSSRTDDPFFLGGQSTFTIDSSTGVFSTLIDIPDVNQGWIVQVFLYTNYADDPKSTFPVAGHEIAINGAVIDTGTGGETGTGAGGTGDCIDCDTGTATGGSDGGGHGGGTPIDTSSVTIEGTSNVAGGSIKVELFGCGGAETYSATSDTEADADGAYPWSTSAITVYPGHNNIGVSNGPVWFNVNLSANNTNAFPAPVLNVALTGATKDTSKDECGRSNWTTDASAVTITGTTQGRDGQGEYHADGTFGRFDIIDGAFSFEVTLYNGFNNIGVNDAEWNRHEVNIETTDGAARPQFVTLDTTTGVASGDVTMTGYVDPAAGGGNFMPNFIGGGMDVDGNWIEFSSDPNAADWGASPLVLSTTPNDAGMYEFSFDVTFADDSNNTGFASPTRINIWADGDGPNGWEGHGLDQPINDSSQQAFFWKPGAKKVVKEVGMSRQMLDKLKAARSKGNH